GVGTDERALIEILTTRTNEEIQAINEAYREAYHKSLEDSLSSDTSGPFKRLLISLIQLIADYLELCGSTDDDSGSMESKFISILCMRSYRHLRRVRSIKNKPSFFAERLYKSMKGAGTDDRTLIRIMVSRSEIDLLNIRHEFKQMYDVSLYTFIEANTSGDYSKVLLAICGGED
ncbi:hypothetical protein scyTo_0011876, partial [Scyliorhinus torazame]|nr:hypothetical protein [Scyliorhinus torazame]